MSPQLTIQILGWNSAQTLPAAAAALQKIPTNQAIIRYIDNASTDTSVAIIRQLLPQAEILVLPDNLGFAEAHNRGLALCTTPLVLLHDPDVVINWAGIQQLLAAFTDPKLAAVQGKLLRAATNVLDSTGITLSLSLNGQERGANEQDQQQYNQPTDIVAVTGACALYRVAALREVAHTPHEIFDADFFAYKEDVDLGWRLCRAAWQVRYMPVTVGTHHRTLGRRGWFNWGLNPMTIYTRLRSPRTRYSFRNWLWLIAKNASTWQAITHSPFIMLRLFVFAGLTILYPPFFAVWVEATRGLSKMRQKRTLATLL